MRRLPVSPRKVISLVNELRGLTEAPRHVLVIGSDGDAVGSVGDTLAAGANAGGTAHLLSMVVLEEGVAPPRLNGSTGVVVMVAGGDELSSAGLKARLDEAHASGVPAVLVLTEAAGMELSFPDAGAGPRRIVSAAPGGRVAPGVLAEAVVDATGDAAVAMSAGLPSLRDEVCRQLVKKTARQNAVVGVLFFLPGSDMPVMTMNEARMVLKIAAAHGESVNRERALELLGIIGAGFGLRGLARQALDLLPGPGWLVKGSIAYSGTRALGQAAQAYFNGGVRVTPAKLEPLAEKIRQLRG